MFALLYNAKIQILFKPTKDYSSIYSSSVSVCQRSRFFFSHGSTVLFLRAIKWNIRRDVKQFTRLCGYRETRARKLMNSYIADGLMERIPYSRGYYRPTKGNFGRE